MTEPYVFKKSQRYYKINDQITLMDGMIDKNPFFKMVQPTTTLQWVMDNPNIVMSKIYKELKSPKTPRLGYGKTVQDVYDYVAHYYATHMDKEFQPHYMGKETSSPYAIEAYVLSNIRVLIYKMVADDDMSAKKFGSVAAILPDSDQQNEMRGTVRESYALGDTQDDLDRLNLDYYFECFEYLYVLAVDATSNLQTEVTPLLVYDYYFGRVEGLTEEEFLTIHNITPRRFETLDRDLSEPSEFQEDMMEMVKELVKPVMNYTFRRQDVADWEFEDL